MQRRAGKISREAVSLATLALPEHALTSDEEVVDARLAVVEIFRNFSESSLGDLSVLAKRDFLFWLSCLLVGSLPPKRAILREEVAGEEKAGTCIAYRAAVAHTPKITVAAKPSWPQAFCLYRGCDCCRCLPRHRPSSMQNSCNSRTFRQRGVLFIATQTDSLSTAASYCCMCFPPRCRFCHGRMCRQRGSDGRSVLFVATQSNSLEMVRLLYALFLYRPLPVMVKTRAEASCL